MRCALLLCVAFLSSFSFAANPYVPELPVAPSSSLNLQRTGSEAGPSDEMLQIDPAAPRRIAELYRSMRVSDEFSFAPSEQPKRKVADANFLLLGTLTFALTAADVELTQHCLHEKTCVELNPTLPHSRWGMYAVNTPVNFAVMYLSYRRKAAGKRDWWIAPIVDIGAHSIGIGSNIRFAR